MENISVENTEINDNPNPKYNSKVTSMLKTYEYTNIQSNDYKGISFGEHNIEFEPIVRESNGVRWTYSKFECSTPIVSDDYRKVLLQVKCYRNTTEGFGALYLGIKNSTDSKGEYSWNELTNNVDVFRDVQFGPNPPIVNSDWSKILLSVQHINIAKGDAEMLKAGAIYLGTLIPDQIDNTYNGKTLHPIFPKCIMTILV